MKLNSLLYFSGALLISGWSVAQSAKELDLKTRCVANPPVHASVSSVIKWIDNPVSLKVSFAVTNLYAATNEYMEINVGGQRRFFYGAGIDSVGNYIPTNYPPVTINAVLRRDYNLNVTCPNSGPQGTPLYKVNNFGWEFGYVDDTISKLTNNSVISSFLWNHFEAGSRNALTSTWADEALKQTNIVVEMNRIISTMSLYDSNIFNGVTFEWDATLKLLNQRPFPTGQSLWELNRLMLAETLGWAYNSASDNSGSASITVAVEPPTQLKIKKTEPEPSYNVIINNQVANSFDLANNGTGYISTNYAILKVLKSTFAHVAAGDGCDDATKSPGQGTWLSMGPGCSPETNRLALQWSVNLGRNFDGIAAGVIAIREPELTRDTFTPFALYYNSLHTNLYAQQVLIPFGQTNANGSPISFTNVTAPLVLIVTNVATVQTNANGAAYTNYESLLRQVKACQAFVDIVTPDTNQTILKFYTPAQVGTNQNATGLYTSFSGEPFVTWTIKNPDPSTTNQLQIIEHRSTGDSVSTLVKTTSGGGVKWTLTQGSGLTTRVETRQISFTSNERQEIDSVAYGTDAPVYNCVETYHHFPWGTELVKTVMPEQNLVTSYAYYTDPIGGSNDDPYGFGYSKLKSITYPDGYWEKREYGVFNLIGAFLARRVMHPSSRGGAVVANPDNADPSTCECEDTQSYDAFTETDHFDHVYPTDEYEFYWQSVLRIKTDEYNQDTPEGKIKESYVRFEDNPFYRTGDLTRVTDFAENNPPGLCAHPRILSTGTSCQTFFYAHGQFDAIGNQFTPNPTNCYYSANTANPDLDHLETEIATSRTVWCSDHDMNDFAQWNLDSDSYLNMEGRDYNIWQVFPLYRNISRKQARIYHSGSLVQAEEYIYTGPGSVVDTYYEGDPQWSLLFKVRYYFDSLGHVTNATHLDINGQPRCLYSASYQDASGKDGELLVSETDEYGHQTDYTYDSLKRLQKMTSKGYGNQPDQVIAYTYDANGQPIQQTLSAGSLYQSESWAVDGAGRLINHVDASGMQTRTSYVVDASGTTITTSLPGNITTISKKGIDRLPLSLEGNGCVAAYYEHAISFPTFPGAVGNYSLREETTRLGHAGSNRWRTQGSDMLGHPDAYQEWPVDSHTTNCFTRCYVKDRILEEKDSNTNTFRYGYDIYSGQMSVSLTMPSDFHLDGWYSSPRNRAIQTESLTCNINNTWYQATTNYAFLSDTESFFDSFPDVPGRTVLSVRLEQLNNFAASQTACFIDYDADGNITTNTTFLDRSQNKITQVIQSAKSTLRATIVYQNGLLISSSTLSVPIPTLYSYDALGRTNSIQDPQGFPTRFTYDQNTGWLKTITDATGQVTSYTYYSPTEANAGKTKCLSINGKNTYYAYTTRGELYRTWGDVIYPAEYRYNEYGDLTNLTTFRSGSGWASPTWPATPGTGDATTWSYDDYSGKLISKTDAQSKSVTYTYDTFGRLLTRSWARSNGTYPTTVTNGYNGFGELQSQEYNDGTPNVYFDNFDHFGNPRHITDASGQCDLTYDLSQRMVSATYTSGLLAGTTVTNHFNPYFGRDAVAVLGLNSPLETDFGYDSFSGRLATVSSGTRLAAYGYVPNSDLLQTTTCSSSGGTVLTTSRTWDYGSRLRSIANVVGGAPVTSHGYQYDAFNRRKKATLEDGSYWNYGYNDRNELTNANRQWSSLQNNTFVTGQQFTYAYDNIGNRQAATFGGDANNSSQSLRSILYTNNSLNQYIGILTPGYENILGIALATNSVTVNALAADRKGEYFHRELTVANGTGPVWQNVTNISGTFATKGGLVFPANSQSLTYDADGNLSSDGIWAYQWDGENRLVSMAMKTNTVSGIAASNVLRLDFVYDFMGRRVQKIVSVWGTTNFVAQTTNLFIYDGWNVLAVVAPTAPKCSILQSFMWGQDLSGTMNQAGGIGGLLSIADSSSISNQPSAHFVSYDGNGNVTALINATDKSVAARYEYSAFGEPLRVTGPMGKANPFRFSTKFSDNESGLVYYGYRYYSPALGRWISRDLAEERGGINLYSFVRNSPLVLFDTDGRMPTSLAQWVVTGAIANWADTLYGISSFPFCGTIEASAMLYAATVNHILDGALFKNVSGAAGFASATAMGAGASVVAGRLKAVAAIGDGATYLLAGRAPANSLSTAGLAYSYIQDAKSGSVYTGLDSILLGNQIGLDMITGPSLYGTGASFASALLQGNAGDAFSYLPEYNALNAWDMLDDLSSSF